MEKKLIYLLFRDSEGSEEVSVPDENESKEGAVEETKEEPKEESKSKENKKETKKSEKKVSITAKEYEEYKSFKLNSMSAEERENALKEENESLLTKISLLEGTIDTQIKEIERIKAQDSIKEKLGNLKTEKPYLSETLDKRASKGFKSVEELNDFVSLVDSSTLKEAYEVLQRTQKATKITGNTVVNTPNGNKVNTDSERPVDLSKYGIRK